MILSRDILIGVALALLIAALVGGLNYWKKYKERELDRIAALVYRFEKGELKREQVEDKVRGTPYYPYFLALIGADPSLIAKELGEEDLKKLYIERKAYVDYSSGKLEEALKDLSHIKKGDFNYISANLLRAFVYEKIGNKKEALRIYEELSKEYGDTYFGKIALTRIYTLK